MRAHKVIKYAHAHANTLIKYAYYFNLNGPYYSELPICIEVHIPLAKCYVIATAVAYNTEHLVSWSFAVFYPT